MSTRVKLCGVFLVLLAVVSTPSSAALITSINSLEVLGMYYDVTFHTPGTSFNALWDEDSDNVFGGGTSIFSSAPTFWGNVAGATAARDAIIVFLGDDDTTTTDGDLFLIPCGAGTRTGSSPCATTSLSAVNGQFIAATEDQQADPASDVANIAGIFDVETLFL